MNKPKKLLLIILSVTGLLLVAYFGFYFLRNETLKSSSVTEELAIRFKAIDKNSIAQKQDSKIWWNNYEGYSLIASTTESVVIVKPWVNQSYISEKIPDEIFKQELAITKEVFETRGFVLNKNNSSVNTSDQIFFDYIQAYEKDGYLCTVTVSNDISSLPVSQGYHLYVDCSDKIKEVEAQQISFLKALNFNHKDVAAELKTSEGDYFHVEIYFRRSSESAILKKENGIYRVLLIAQEAPSCSLLEKEKIPASVLDNIGSGDCYNDQGQYAFRVDKTEYFSYSLKGEPAIVSKEVKPFDWTADKLKALADECDTKYSVGYFDKLIAKFKDTDKVVYNFAYQGETQDSGPFTITILPNKTGYTSLAEFKKDFEQCFIAGDAYPLSLNKDWLLFANSCTSGVDDESKRPHGYANIQEAVESTLKLN